jgi:hypothetical protein
MKTFCFWAENGMILKIKNRVHIMYNQNGNKKKNIFQRYQEYHDSLGAGGKFLLELVTVMAIGAIALIVIYLWFKIALV